MSTEGLSIPGISMGSSGAGAADRVRRFRLAGVFAALRRGVFAPLRRPVVTTVCVELAVAMLVVLDVWLVVPPKAPPYSIYLSGAACLAVVLRRRFPFLAMLAAVPGFLVGWAQLASMITLGMLATRRQLGWQTWVGAALVFTCRFVQWPLDEFTQLGWREHFLDGIYSVFVAGMPITIALLIGARAEISAKLAELAKSRDRERRLYADTIRAEERARLAREMHDVVSHQITLIAMQAGALQAQAKEGPALETAQVIRGLSTRTLEELRSLVSVLRSGSEDDGPRPGIGELDHLIRTADVPVQLSVEQLPDTLPSQVSAAAYRTVQECLTNVHKHAPGATATIRIQAASGGLDIEVENERASRTGEHLPSGGHGLTGLAERARLLGGSFETSGTKNGGFRVRARYPLDR
ncbi:sensor histidine kinase [Amycolatopsis jiangsuensis]|uniref:histidine kinase n=1 Tax=Amycolatopsis jiangsuensis TaxID=1181879 RepID=A0A840ITV7_9PSEU|nr:histidine kinase [Amycolatopsis jiangsuensis]MBB4684588.1 signal transduction histidine kinase [Amycolatopsis jiangsuensis]